MPNDYDLLVHCMTTSAAQGQLHVELFSAPRRRMERPRIQDQAKAKLGNTSSHLVRCTASSNNCSCKVNIKRREYLLTYHSYTGLLAEICVNKRHERRAHQALENLCRCPGPNPSQPQAIYFHTNINPDP